MTSPAVSIIVVNFNGRALLEACLPAIPPACDGLAVEILVVDNGSTDDSRAVAEAAGAVWLPMGRNAGYAAAANAGMRRAQGAAWLVMNNDVTLAPGSVRRACAFLEQEPRAGALGFRLENPDGTLQPSGRRAPTPLGALRQHWRLGGDAYREERDYAQVADVEEVSGACMLLRPEAARAVDLMDEVFFFYYEDVDLCVRLRAAGWRVVYYPPAVAVHAWGATSQAAGWIKVVGRKSMLRYFGKHHGAGTAWALRAALLPLDLARLALSLLKGEVGTAWRLLTAADDGAPSLVANVGWTFAARMLGQVLNYLAFVIIAQRLGSTGVGQYTFVYAQLGLGLILTHQGIETYLTRELAQAPGRVTEFGFQALLVKLVLAGVAFSGMLAWIAATARDPVVVTASVIAAVTHAAQALDGVALAILTAEERLGLIAVTMLVERVLAIAGIAGALAAGGGVVAVCAALLTSTLVATALHAAALARHAWRWMAPDRALIRTMVVDALPFGLVAIFQYLYMRVDSILLFHLVGDGPTGMYSVAHRTIEAALFVPFAVMTAVFPRLARLWTEGEGPFDATARTTLDALVRLAVPSGVGLALVAGTAIRTLYGAGFLPALLPLQILSITLVLLHLNLFCGLLLSVQGRQGTYAAVAGCAAFVNVIANLVLIPTHGSAGAAGAAVLSDATSFACYLWLLRGTLSRIARPAALAQALAGSALMAVALRSFADLALFPSIALGAAVYGAFSAVTRW